MRRVSVFIICVVLNATSASEPQIYEKPEDQMGVESNARVIRQPYIQPKPIYRPPVFNYHQITQQDLRRSRYAQQQQLDMRNILSKNPEAPLRVSLVQNWKVIDPTVASSTIEQNYHPPEEKNSTSSSTTQQLSTKKPVTSRKMKPNSYYEDLTDRKVRREDSNKIHPEFTKNKRSDYDLNALNALVGQDPNNQLEGLKRLLESPKSNFVLPLIKGPLPPPITEEIDDIPNPNTHPNIDTSGMSIDSLQTQLDEAAKAQLAQALADAQKEALAHVEAQHKAIAKAQEEAQRKALAQIALHNQQIKAESLPQPLALGLKQKIVPTPISLPLRHTPIPQVVAYQQPLALQLGYKGTPKPITLTVRQRPVNFYAPSHNHQQSNGQVVSAQNNGNLKKISITKTHSVTQNHQSPNTYQEVLLETQQKKQKNYSGITNLQDLVDDAGDHQYAARYAFGYKIRDVQEGNEFGHEEKRDGENAKGFYHVLLPDGRMQKVEYSADEGGYRAKVTYEDMTH